MMNDLTILGAVFCACVLTGCVQRKVTGNRPANAPSRFDRPAHHFIYVGMSEQDRLNLMGDPSDIKRQEERQIWYYDFGVVMMRDHRVVYRYPPSPLSSPTPADHNRSRSDHN